jgi:GNAT superfamily N-acetyltransferase
MTIREAAPDDLPRVREMAAAFLAGTAYGALLPASPEALERIVAVVAAHGVILVADADAQLVGMLALVEMPHLITGEPSVEEMAWWVDPAARAGSVGPRLLTAGEEWVRARGGSLLKMVAPAGTRVGHYYERRGYQAVETTYAKRV